MSEPSGSQPLERGFRRETLLARGEVLQRAGDGEPGWWIPLRDSEVVEMLDALEQIAHMNWADAGWRILFQRCQHIARAALREPLSALVRNPRAVR